MLTPADHARLVALIEELDRTGIALLRTLGPGDWLRPANAGGWRVREVVAHLADGAVRRLSFGRDGMAPPPPPRHTTSQAALTAWLDELNAGWVAAMARMSPRQLTDLVERTASELAAYLSTLEPEGPALFPVAWAGERASAHWFDIAREYTERWHHWMQIRETAGAPLLDEPRWVRPILEAAVCALPHGYRAVPAPAGTTVALIVTGPAGAAWRLVRRDAGWELHQGTSDAPAAVVTMDATTAWRLFYKMLPPDEAARRATVAGDAFLAAPLFTTLALMAAPLRQL